MRKFTLLFLFFIICSISNVSAYFISIDANEEMCFFERITSATKMGLMFEVAEGGFLDIDVKVCGFLIVDIFMQTFRFKVYLFK